MYVVLDTTEIFSAREWHTKYKFQGHSILFTGSKTACEQYVQDWIAEMLA